MEIHAEGGYGAEMALDGFDLDDFWEPSADALELYVAEPLTSDVLAHVERALGFTLPAAYVELARHQNGGFPKRTRHPSEPTSWAEDHVAINGIFGIGGSKPNTLLGHSGSTFWTSEWGYPEIGVYFADCPSGGHDMLCLDYRHVGPTGEPQVVHVDQEFDYKITVLAADFASFLRGLVLEED